ncbi:MAG: LON peptidase substrate-binding domain-containing protein [Bacteroidia bacterium]
MSHFIPLFPLGMVVFPGERFRLHIFEDRYKQLITECIGESKTFGIPAVIDSNLAEVATEVQVVSVDRRLAGGEMDITAEGRRRLRILRFYRVAKGKSYPGGDCEWLETDYTNDPAMQAQILSQIEHLHNALGLSQRFDVSQMRRLSFEVGHHVGLSLKQELSLLSLREEPARLRFIGEHLERVLPVVLETERLKSRAKLNGHYKNLLPPDY